MEKSIHQPQQVDPIDISYIHSKKNLNIIHFDVINVVMYLFLCNIGISYLSVFNLINSVPANVYNAHVYAN